MFIVQAPGNIIIIIFQAVLSHQDWSTWISYLITFIQQGTIVVILVVLKCHLCRSNFEVDDTREIDEDIDFLLQDEV